MSKVLTLGEIMLRLSTSVGERISDTPEFIVNYGGGEANVAVSLANFGHETNFASKVPDNSLGFAVKKHLARNGVGTKHLIFGGERLGTYFLESGVGERADSVIYDRKGSSFATMDTLEWDLDDLFSKVELFHISGIVPALSERWQKLTLELLNIAKSKDVKISFDVNFRRKLWTEKQAAKSIKQIIPYVDYLSAGILDAREFMELELDKNSNNPMEDAYRRMISAYPNIQVIYASKRTVNSSSSNDFVGTLFAGGKYYESKSHHIEPIVDRVGGGDAYASGVLHGLLTGMESQDIVDFAAAASALKHTVNGDANMFSAEEVEQFVKNGSGKIKR